MPEAPLVQYLKQHGPLYYGKVHEIRESIAEWLSYIPASFPHYTRHTIGHSDEIVSQLSKLLFHDDDHNRPVIQLSSVEAYILIAAAYLHDAGMVCSDREKIAILASDAWKEWVTDDSGAARWAEINELRHHPKDLVKGFLADIQLRFLIAEFVRRQHHVRAAEFLAQHEDALGRCAFNDPALKRTIADVCVAHGLRHRELEDGSRFPLQRDVRGEKVNVRLMAVLLRLGDLMDMSHDRACPLLTNAACPIPADSLAHWTQYQRITHRLTSPERIEITAECNNQSEHRVLQDWCHWIVEEVNNAHLVAGKFSRHKDWTPPHASFGPENRSIDIRPAREADYFFTTWRIEFDEAAVLDRLIHDVYESSHAFVRELIQNAADANRCQMYLDLMKAGERLPVYPNLVPESWGERYPIRVRLYTREFDNELSGERETRQVLSIEDAGIGMDKDVIANYFLQVGRSFYTSSEFRREFAFAPTSRFGIGFLSVFGASENVTVETYKPSSSDGPIRLQLSGPRSYLLTQVGRRTSPGTRIDLVLKKALESEKLTQLVSGLCRRLEFPVVIDDLGKTSELQSELPSQFVKEIPSLSEEGAVFAIRCFPIESEGVFGELYVFAHRSSRGESWASHSWAEHSYLKQYPRAAIPELPESVTCLHGIADERRMLRVRGQVSTRIDIRSSAAETSLSRSRVTEDVSRPAVEATMETALRTHFAGTPFAGGPDAWKYKQDVCAAGFYLPTFWLHEPDTLRVLTNGEPQSLSLAQMLQNPEFAICFDVSIVRWLSSQPVPAELVERERKHALTIRDVPVFTNIDLLQLSSFFKEQLFALTSPARLARLDDTTWLLHWSRGRTQSEKIGKDMWGLPFADSRRVALIAHRFGNEYSESVLLNLQHPFGQWVKRVGEACKRRTNGLDPKQFERLIALLVDAFKYAHLAAGCQRFLAHWRAISDMPAELVPPVLEEAETAQREYGITRGVVAKHKDKS